MHTEQLFSTAKCLDIVNDKNNSMTVNINKKSKFVFIQSSFSDKTKLVMWIITMA